MVDDVDLYNIRQLLLRFKDHQIQLIMESGDITIVCSIQTESLDVQLDYKSRKTDKITKILKALLACLEDDGFSSRDNRAIEES